MKAFISIAVLAVALFAAFVPVAEADSYAEAAYREWYACRNAGWPAACKTPGRWGVVVNGGSYGGGEYYPSPDTRERVRVTETAGGGRVIERSPDNTTVVLEGLSKAAQTAAVIGTIILLGK